MVNTPIIFLREVTLGFACFLYRLFSGSVGQTTLGAQFIIRGLFLLHHDSLRYPVSNNATEEPCTFLQTEIQGHITLLNNFRHTQRRIE